MVAPVNTARPLVGSLRGDAIAGATARWAIEPNMIKMGADPEVRTALEAMSQPRRAAVVGKLAQRMWEMARIEKEADLPGALQITAKDSLIALRKYSDEQQKQQIDNYLIDWYAV